MTPWPILWKTQSLLTGVGMICLPLFGMIGIPKILDPNLFPGKFHSASKFFVFGFHAILPFVTGLADILT